MTYMLDGLPIKIHIVQDDCKTPAKHRRTKEVRQTTRTFALSNTAEPQMLLGHAPNRIRAVLQFSNNGPVVIGTSRADVMRQDSASAAISVAPDGPIEVRTTAELWAQSTVAAITNCAVIAEYDE